MTVVAGYDLVELSGVWFLEKDDRIRATLIDMGDGTWRARTPGGEARTVEVPVGTGDPARYVAGQIT